MVCFVWLFVYPVLLLPPKFSLVYYLLYLLYSTCKEKGGAASVCLCIQALPSLILVLLFIRVET
ncbi:hypothetical protein GGS20DRAFT_536736 [Poronia punctata]|nr:hypothetical protein GGS20DRAFT_536736 [Poronia punctata]